ncbi:MAG: DUF2007 domain-containing protein [Bacteroidota bacterium]|nr:DUF2007 domain-containing protein [Bacteroidota bacterium]
MQFVVLQSYTNYIDANIIMGRLQEEGINCWLKDENTFIIAPVFSSAFAIKLMVAETQAERALDILKPAEE